MKIECPKEVFLPDISASRGGIFNILIFHVQRGRPRLRAETWHFGVQARTMKMAFLRLPESGGVSGLYFALF